MINTNKIKFTLSLLLIFQCLFLFSNKKISFEEFSSRDGLSQNTVRTIIQDQKGYIWLGTVDGINRYDGYKFLTFKPQQSKNLTITDFRIKELKEDKRGFLWIKSYNNEYYCFNPQTNRFIDLGLENNNFRSLFEAKDGTIWLYHELNGVVNLSFKNNKYILNENINYEVLKSNKGFNFIHEDSEQNIWIGTNSAIYTIDKSHQLHKITGGSSYTSIIEQNNSLYITYNSSILIIDKQSKKIKEEKTSHFKNETFINSLYLNQNEILIISRGSIGYPVIFDIQKESFHTPEWENLSQLKGIIEVVKDNKNGIWLYNHTGNVWYYNTLNKKSKHFVFIPPSIMNIIDLERYNFLVDSQGILWISTYGNGLFCYNPITDNLQHFKNEINNNNSIASDYLLSIIEDNNMNIWVGSEFAGLIKVFRNNLNYHSYKIEKESNIGKNNNIRSIFEDSNKNIWIGTRSGNLFRYNPQKNETSLIKESINPYSFCEDETEHLWIGTKGHGVYRYNLVTNKIVNHLYHESKQTPITNNQIFGLLKDKDGFIWIGSYGGGINLVKVENEKLYIQNFFSTAGNKRYVRHLMQDSDENIWASTSGGIIRFNPKNILKDSLDYKTFIQDKNAINSIGTNDIKSCFQSSDGKIWIGTAGGGLSCYTHNANIENIKTYNIENGLSSDMISGILEDNHKNLWISTENGINKLDIQTNSFSRYHFAKSPYGNHFNENSNIKLEDGTMLWGSLDGLIYINPDSIFIPQKTSFNTCITNFYLHNQRLDPSKDSLTLQKDISYTDTLILNYKQNSFTIEFSNLNFNNLQELENFYQLENFDANWALTSQENKVSYKNIPPGKYTFNIKTIDHNTNKDIITSLFIKITPPYWQTDIAYIIYFIIICGIFLVIYNVLNNIQSLRNNIKIEKELTNHKLRFFTNVSHEFKTPLTLIDNSVEVIKDKIGINPLINNHVQILDRNTKRLSQLINQLLEFRKIQNQIIVLNLEKLDIISVAKYVFYSLQETANQKEISYQFNSNFDQYIFYFDAQKIETVILNLLSNSLKFTSQNESILLNINIIEEKNICQIEVIDTGIGIEESKRNLLFSRFMQINFSETGTGIGLSLAKEFIESHKGEIKYENNKPKGSIFRIEFPIQANYENANIIERQTSKLYQEKNKEANSFKDIESEILKDYHILIIEDNYDLLHILKNTFSEYVTVDIIDNGAKGIEKAIEGSPDLIICDVMLPEKDGFEITKELKSNFQTSHIPIILLTACSSLEDHLEGIKCGADYYITKPFSIKFLSSVVINLIQQREALKEKYSKNSLLSTTLLSNTDADKNFIDSIEKILDKNYADSSFSVDQFASSAQLSRTLFYKKIKGITGNTPNNLIKTKRLNKAAELLLTENYNVSEIAYMVGYDDPFYFSKLFKTHFKCSPSEFKEHIKAKQSE